MCIKEYYKQLQELLNKLKLNYLDDLDRDLVEVSADLLTNILTSKLYDYSTKKIEVSEELLMDLISDISVVKNRGLWSYKAEADVMANKKKWQEINQWLYNVATIEDRAIFEAEMDKSKEEFYKQFEI